MYTRELECVLPVLKRLTETVHVQCIGDTKVNFKYTLSDFASCMSWWFSWPDTLG